MLKVFLCYKGLTVRLIQSKKDGRLVRAVISTFKTKDIFIEQKWLMILNFQDNWIQRRKITNLKIHNKAILRNEDEPSCIPKPGQKVLNITSHKSNIALVVLF